MEKWGGTGTETLKDAIDDMFTGDSDPFKMEDNDYNVCFTADGVNLGKNGGL